MRRIPCFRPAHQLPTSLLRLWFPPVAFRMPVQPDPEAPILLNVIDGRQADCGLTGPVTWLRPPAAAPPPSAAIDRNRTCPWYGLDQWLD